MNGTYWLTVLPETSQLRPKIKAALKGVDKDAKITPKYDTKGAKQAGAKAGKDLRAGVETETRKSSLGKLLRLDGAKASGQTAGSNFSSGFRSGSSSIGSGLKSLFSGSSGGAGVNQIAQSSGMQMGTKFAGAFKGALAAAGIAGGVAALVGSLKDVTDTGLSYERQMNTLKGVTQATDAQMEQLRATAKALGTDTTMAGVGTSDAAAAMVELTKGGLSAEQAMSAARGTLQLATAGQVSGAEAAKTQSAALNMFQLDASKAAHVADLLANAANASAADIPDLSLALQQGGSAAAGFGMDIDETMTALTMFSKWGINGSDAGTMLKTSLLAITDQGNPAQGAIEALGLSLYDANGEFVGYTDMMKQVAAASKRMTAEQFQANTAVLFGSDAMRASMISANGGADAIDGITTALQRDGAAAELAGSQMEGLPGVVEGIKNMWEGVKLTLFDVLDGPLQKIGNFVLGLANGDTSMLPDWLTGGFEKLGEIGRSVLPALKQGWDILAPAVKQFVDQLKPIIEQHAPKFMQFLSDMKPVAIAVGAVLGGIFLGLLKVLPPVLSAVAKVQQVLWAVSGGAVQAVVGAFKLVGTTAMWLWNNAIKPAWSGIQTAIGVGWAVIQNVFGAFKTAISGVGSAFQFAFNDFILPMWHNMQTVASAAWSVISPIWNGFKSAVTTAGQTFSSVFGTVFAPVWESIKSAFSTGWTFISGIFEQMKGGFKAVADFIGGAWNGISGAVKSALDGVVSAIRPALHAIGGMLTAIPNGVFGLELPGVDTAHALGQKLLGFREGGTVAGPGGVDNVLAMLTAGEGVVTKSAMARGGAPIVQALNAGWVPPLDMLKAMLPGFESGGTVGPDTRVAEQLAGTGYSQATRFDCSGTVARVINGALGLDGGLMSTKNARQWLSERGFVDGTGERGQISVGWYDRGPNPNDGHMAMTLSDGRNAEQGGSNGVFTIGAGAAGADDPQFDNRMYLPQTFSGEGAATSGSLGSSTSASAGSTRAVQSATTALKNAGQSVDDKTFTRDRAQARLDKARAEGKDTVDEQHSLDVANRELDDAKERQQTATDRLAEAQNKAADGVESSAESAGDGGIGDLGKSLVDGLFETIGLDGSVFSNPFEWPTVKSAMAGVNWLGKALMGDEDSAASGLGGDLSGPLDMLTNLNPGANVAAPANNVAPDTTTHGGGQGQAPGPGVYIENAGMSPVDVANTLDSQWNARTRTTKVH